MSATPKFEPTPDIDAEFTETPAKPDEHAKPAPKEEPKEKKPAPKAAVPDTSDWSEDEDHGHDAHGGGHGGHGEHGAKKPHSKPGSSVFSNLKGVHISQRTKSIAGAVALVLAGAGVGIYATSDGKHDRKKPVIELTDENEKGKGETEEVVEIDEHGDAKTTTKTKKVDQKEVINNPYENVSFKGTYSRDAKNNWKFEIEDKKISKNSGKKKIAAKAIESFESNGIATLIIKFTIDNDGDDIVYKSNEYRVNVDGTSTDGTYTGEIDCDAKLRY